MDGVNKKFKKYVEKRRKFKSLRSIVKILRELISYCQQKKDKKKKKMRRKKEEKKMRRKKKGK